MEIQLSWRLHQVTSLHGTTVKRESLPDAFAPGQMITHSINKCVGWIEWNLDLRWSLHRFIVIEKSRLVRYLKIHQLLEIPTQVRNELFIMNRRPCKTSFQLRGVG